MPPTEAAPALASSTKRKGKDISDAGHAPNPPNPPKRSKTNPPRQTNSLIAPHETLLSHLRPKYNVLAASVISSTKIGKRVAQITSHLSGESDPNQPPLVLLYARPAEVCKMITIVEQCKRIMQAEGRSWFQYNQMYEVPAREGDVVEKVVENKKKKDKNKNKKETEKVKEKDTEGREVEPDDDEHDDEDEDEDDDEDDAFEAMAGRFEKAVGGDSAAKERTVRSLRVMLRSGQAMRDWRDEKGVTMQSSEEAGT